MSQILYEFVSTGADDVRSSFVTIQAAAEQSAQRVEKSYQRGGKAAKTMADIQKMSASQAAAELKRITDKEDSDFIKSVDKRIAYEKKAAEKIAKERKKQADQSARASEREAEAFSRSRAKMLSSAASFVGNGVMRVAGMAATALTGAVGGAIRESLNLDDIARRVSINARSAGGEFQDPTALRKKFEQTAIATPGVASKDIGEATQAYIDFTGDVDTAIGSMKTFATVASATGADVKNVALAGASFGEKFGVKTAEDIQKMFAVLIFQGKGAKLTLEQMGAAAQRLAPAAQAFGVEQGVGGIAKVGGLLQIARSGTGSAAQAVTGTENILTGLKLRAKKFAGVDIYDKTGKTRDVDQVLAETIAKAGGGNKPAQDAALAKIFGRGAGIRAVNPLIGAARAASDAAGGGKAGTQAAVDAVMAALRKVTDSTDAWSEVQRDAAFAQQSTGAQLDAAWENFKAQIADKAVPALHKFIPVLLDNVGPLAKSLSSLAQVAAMAARSLGWLKEPTHVEKAADLEERATRAKTPEEAAALRKQAEVEKVRAQSGEGKREKARVTEDEFIKQFTAAGGGGLGDRARASLAAHFAKGGFGSTGFNIEAGKGTSGMNPEQARLYKEYREQVESAQKGEQTRNGVQVAGKIGGIATAEGESVKADTQASIAAAKAAKANEELAISAGKAKKALDDMGNARGHIAGGADSPARR